MAVVDPELEEAPRSGPRDARGPLSEASKWKLPRARRLPRVRDKDNFDGDLAIALAELSQIAYSPFEEDGGAAMKDLLAAGGYALLDTFQWTPVEAHTKPRDKWRWRDRGAQAFLAANDDQAVLCFRGTTDEKDWATNTQAKPQPSPYDLPGLTFHKGFWRAYEQIADQIELAVLQHVAGSGKTLFITGHSLGGALAQISAAHLCQVKPGIDIGCVYTFGAPRAANGAYKKVVPVPLHRVINGWDVVPIVPPGGLAYSHAGQPRLLRFDPPRTIAQPRGRFVLRVLFINLLSLVSVAFRMEWVGTRHHNLLLYRERLEEAKKKGLI